MINKLSRLIKLLIKLLGYSISKIKKKGFINFKEDKKINVGCGDNILTEYINCDSREAIGVDLVCNAWELSKYIPFKVEHVYCRHMLEHLTLKEVQATLNDWFEILEIYGYIEIIVPNLSFHINQFLNAIWNIDNLNQSNSDASWGLAGLYGWQRECDPTLPNYNDSYWDVHKIGFNENLLRFLLMRAGYSNIDINIEEDIHLVAKAKKLTIKGERQVSPFIQDIRIDHRTRYQLASNYVKDGFQILDAACGIGYGCSILKKNNNNIKIIGLDIDTGAIQYANEYYKSEGIDFYQTDILNAELKKSKFDVIVCFETLEHIENDTLLLTNFYDTLKNSGKLILSTPNQLNMPYSKSSFPFHIKHYDPKSLILLLENSGFIIEEVFSQPSGESDLITEGWNGCFNIVVCSPRSAY